VPLAPWKGGSRSISILSGQREKKERGGIYIDQLRGIEKDNEFYFLLNKGG